MVPAALLVLGYHLVVFAGDPSPSFLDQTQTRMSQGVSQGANRLDQDVFIPVDQSGVLERGDKRGAFPERLLNVYPISTEKALNADYRLRAHNNAETFIDAHRFGVSSQKRFFRNLIFF